MKFKDPSEVTKYFLQDKKPFCNGIKDEDDGMFLIEQIRKEMYRSLIKGLKVTIEKEGSNINTGEIFKISMGWSNNVAKMNEFRFAIDYDGKYIELYPTEQASRIRVKEFKYGQIISRVWEFNSLRNIFGHICYLWGSKVLPVG